MRRKERRSGRTAANALLALAAALMLGLLVPSAGPVGVESDMLAAASPVETPEAALLASVPTAAPTLAAPAATPEPRVEPPQPTEMPTAVPVTSALTQGPHIEPTGTPPSAPTIAAPTAEPTIVSTATPEPHTAHPQPTTAPTASSTAVASSREQPSPAEPDFTIRATPSPTPAPRFSGEAFDPRGDGSMIVRLPMDDFSGGSTLHSANLSADRQTYSDGSITVTVYQERVDFTTYTVADITIADASQLRTAIAGTPTSAARARMTALAGRVNAVVAIDGDYYADRKGAYAVRQGTLLAESLANDLDLLVIDYDGNFHGILATEKEEALAALEGQIYQCLCFGPVLIRDGEKIDYPARYPFGLNYLNPRAGIGQLGERHYLLVVASGRTTKSMSITAATLRDYMYAKGCIQAYNVDGGASAEMVFCGGIASPLTDSGERGLYDILYFASTAGEETP